MPKFVENPSDPGIPTLAAALDPAELAKQLSLLSFPWQWDTTQAIQLRVLRWDRASRCTFEIALKTEHGWQELIGKVYAEDRSDVYQAMEEIRRGRFGSEEEFSIPRPLAFLTALRLLLYEKVPGTRAIKLILGSNESDRVRAADRCACWLARFHALAPRSGPFFHLDDHLLSLERAWRGLADLGWPFADKASQLFGQLNTTAQGLGTIEMCASHGTYTPGQVILSEGRTVTIDWDTYNVADPSYDVARFLVELKRMGLKYFGSIHALDRAAEIFLRSYFAAARSEMTPHLAFQEAAICLERAKHDVEKQAPRWSERAETMLDEGLHVLAQKEQHIV